MLTWESEQIAGSAAIIAKLAVSSVEQTSSASSACALRPRVERGLNGLPEIGQLPAPSFADRQGLPFSKVVHRLLTLDAQPSTPGSQSIIVVVTGQLLVDDGSNVLQYTQMFHVGSNATFVLNVRVLMSARPGGRKLLCPERRFPTVRLRRFCGAKTQLTASVYG